MMSGPSAELEEVIYEDEDLTLVKHRSMYNPKKEEDIRWHNFWTRCVVSQYVCDLIIDGECSKNIVFKTKVTKLNCIHHYIILSCWVN